MYTLPPKAVSPSMPPSLRRLCTLAAIVLTGACSTEPAPSSGSGNSTAQSGSSSVSSSPLPTGSASQAGARDVPSPRPPNAAELAFLSPLAVGSTLSGWNIAEVRGITQGTLDLVCTKGGSKVILSIALHAPGGAEPPALAEPYAVYYSVRGEQTLEGETLAKALAAVLEKNKGGPPPPGLMPFVPRPQSL
ncbi:MAG: hypothetical protein IPK82_32575 [Polyangiaceae bacterium]|nr:hypothetical protein [Polyangiaceae bacterium]